MDIALDIANDFIITILNIYGITIILLTRTTTTTIKVMIINASVTFIAIKFQASNE